jgi:hypothetical protein
MISPPLHRFIDSLMATGRITAEDVKHLHRDLLPDGISSHAVADALLALDRTLDADPIWSDFLTPAIVDFAVWGLRPTGVINAETEPPRVCRRLLLLRGWSHDEENTSLFP